MENKIWSPEGDLQIHRYLDGFKIIDGAHGRVVYLTPRRQWPRGVAKGDDRVVAMSYYDLAELLDVGLQSDKERHERGRVFAKEFVDGIHRLLKLRIEMTKPPLSEATKLLLAHGKQFAELKQAAIDESGEFIQWLFFEAGRRLKAVLGPDMEKLSWGDSIYCYLPSWKIGEGVFGIAFAMRADPQNRFIAEHPEGPWVSVGIIQPDGSELKSVCQPICDRLHEALRKVWPYAEDLAAPSYSFPLWRYVPVPSDGDLNGWADEVLRLMEEMATALAPALTKAAAGAKPVE